MKRIRGLATSGIVAVGTALAGCASRSPLASWREAFTAYIAREGHGDPHVIRDLPELRSRYGARPGRIVFGVLDGGRSRDVQGVYVGQDVWAGVTWYFFVVGVVERKLGRYMQLEDLRLVALAAKRGHLHWRVSARDRDAPGRYIGGEGATSLFHHGQVRGVAFPHVLDDFTLHVDGAVAAVREHRSGVVLTVPLAPVSPIREGIRQARTPQDPERRR